MTCHVEKQYVLKRQNRNIYGKQKGAVQLNSLLCYGLKKTVHFFNWCSGKTGKLAKQTLCRRNALTKTVFKICFQYHFAVCYSDLLHDARVKGQAHCDTVYVRKQENY